MKEDISKKNNLASANPGKATEMLALLNTWKKEVSAPEPTKLNPGYHQ